MPSTRPLWTRRTVRLLVIAAVALAHVGLLFLVSTLHRPERASPPVREAFEVMPTAPFQPVQSPPPRLTAQRKRKLRQVEQQQAAAAPASRPTATGPATGATPGAQPGQGPLGRDMPDPWAVQEALRGSVGCDYEALRLRPDERDRCNDRAAKVAKKAAKIGPSADDPKRAAELAAEEDYQRRRLEWKTTNCGVGVGGDAKSTLGQMPPRRGQSKTGEDAERRNAC